MKIKKKLLTVLMLAVMFTSIELMPVYGANADIQNLIADGAYNSVILQWDPVAGEPSYEFTVNGKPVAAKNIKSMGTIKGKVTYKITGLETLKSYTLGVAAVTADGKTAEKTVKGSPVRTMTYRLTSKRSITLKAHAGGKGKYRVKKGEVIEATGFTAGRYIFKKNGKTYFIATSRIKKAKAIYAKKKNYSDLSAETFVNDKGLTSRTKTLMWVNTYTQHTYMFKGSKGKWKVVDSWECATGKAKSPTPTGMTGRKQIWKKIRSRHGLVWWSPFSSMNSFHSLRKNWTVGKPASGGCVRTPTKKCKKVYKEAPIGTTVLVF